MPAVRDLQCSWQLLVQCSVPMANHVLRTVPPSHCEGYAMDHDDGVWDTAVALLGGLPGEDKDVHRARR
eukprot:718493-Karenia_brevis.AAC.1